MQNRNYKIDGEDIRDVISKEWRLSVAESDALCAFIEVLRVGDLEKLVLVTATIEKDWRHVLDKIPESGIENHVVMEDSRAIGEFSDQELSEEVSYRGLIVEEDGTNLKDDMDREELLHLFFSKSWAEREELLKKLRE